MLTPTLLNVILALQVLTMLTMYISALPITSKPIEGTVEHLAWQAWLMLPPEQKSLEKSRKVTPKSIFTLPFRECPQGHQLFENRCIPTVNIDKGELLNQELQILLGELGGSVNNYEFDYDEGGEEEVPDVVYEPAEKLSGTAENDGSYNSYDQLPSQDEPLKFNIFQQKFPTDYETETMPSEEEETQEQTGKSAAPPLTANVNVTTTPLAEAINALATPAEPSLNATQQKNSSSDLQLESTNMSTSIMPTVINTDSNTDAQRDNVTPTTTQFAISDIDAIVLPAVAVPTHNADLESEAQNLQKFSLFKDDSSVQLVTSAQQQPDLTQLLKADDLLPLPNVAPTGWMDDVATTATLMRTRTTTFQRAADNDGVSMSSSSSSSSSSGSSTTGTTTPLSSTSTGDDAENSEATDMMLSDMEATVPTLLIEKVMEPVEDSKKAERTRSVNATATDDALEPQETNFTTTNEPEMTTSFQLDETTVDETHDAPTIALKELLQLAQHPSESMRENLGVVKKSKVEPVEVPPPAIEIAEEAQLDVMSAPKQLTPPTTIAHTTVSKLPATASTPSPVTTTTAAATTLITSDRFDYAQQTVDSASEDSTIAAIRSDIATADSNLRNNAKPTTTSTTTTTPTSTTTSEIDIEQALRMFNESVKGHDSQRQQQQQQHQESLSTPVGTSSTESSFTTVTEKSETASASSDKDKIINTKATMTTTTTSTTTEEEESRTSTTAATTTPVLASTTTSETTTTAEPTTLWSKIMPFLGLSAVPVETTTTQNEMTATTVDSATGNKNIAAPPTITSSRSSILPAAESSTSSSNRSNRNSKIIRINSISAPSFNSDSSSYSKNIAAGKKPTQMATTATAATTTVFTTTNNADTDEGSGSDTAIDIVDQVEPFWWLPLGWRFDAPNDNDHQSVNSEPSLLLRFLSAFPSNTKK